MSKSQINVIETTARRLTHVSPGQSIIEQTRLAPTQPNEIMVETHFSGISRGTERLVLTGRVPVSEWQSMRCPNQSGEFSFPITYGYSCVGKVIAAGNNVTAIREGQMVFVLHPHQDRFVTTEEWVTPLPQELDPATAVLSANMETALNAVWDAEIDGDQCVAVMGAGVVGLLTAFLVRSLTKNKPTVFDVDERKRATAELLGLDFQNPNEKSSEQVPEFDRVFNTTAAGNALQFAIDNAKFEGRIIEMSWFGDNEVTLRLGGAFHSKRLLIVSSQVGHVSPAKRHKVDHKARLQQAMTMLDEPALANLLTPAIKFDKLPELISDILSTESAALCPLVSYMD